MKLRCKIAYYIHHHGSGHFMRALAIAGELYDCDITFIGSGLFTYQSLIPEHIKVLHLPMDTPHPDEDLSIIQHDPVGLHYAPLHVNGLKQRVAIMTDFFLSSRAMILVVDVSVEVAMLARLAGIPTIVVKQHGIRTDLAHELCYRNAHTLLAPYSKELDDEDREWLTQKTYFTGGLARFSVAPDQTDSTCRKVAVLVGAGGSSINYDFVSHLGRTCPGWEFHIIGAIHWKDEATTNLVYYGQLEDPRGVLRKCGLVIGNAGHNTVMEMAALNKRFIVIPEERPYDEQGEKARLLAQKGLASVVEREDIYRDDWEDVLQKAITKPAGWTGIADTDAAKCAAIYLISQFEQIYSG